MGTLKRQVEQRLSVTLPIIEQAKIQAQVLVPLVKALQWASHCDFRYRLQSDPD
jgi:hypothetical protein